MKKMSFKAPMTVFLLAAMTGISAQAAETYVLTITNGSAMPLSPGVAYVKSGQEGAAPVGSAASRGFVQLCQMGDAMSRAQELRMTSGVSSVVPTMGLIQPGESRTLEIQVENPLMQSIHFETMYGKTKDLCAVAHVNSHSLVALKQRVTSTVNLKDDVLQTGAFMDPALPQGRSYLDMNICMGETSAVGCLRRLSLPNSMPSKIRFFAGYLPSLSMHLEMQYGAMEAQSLQIPTSGSVQVQVKVKN